MGEPFQLPVAMWRVQYDLLGGYRRLLIVTSVYLTLLTVVAGGVYQLMPKADLPSFAPVGLNILTGIQALILILGGANALHRAAMRDYQTKMIESHRLTPMSSPGVVLGYLFGPTFGVLILFCGNVAFGVVLTFMGRLPISAWLFGNLLMLAGAVMLWSMAVFVGLRSAKPINLSAVLFIVGLFSASGIWVLPGLAALLGAYPLLMSFGVISGKTSLHAPSVAAVMSATLVLTVYWLSAAAAKYRRPDLPALNAKRGLVLLVLWLVLGTGGIVAFKTLSGRMIQAWPGGGDPNQVQWIATMIIALAIAIIPLNGAVHCRMLIARGASLRDRWDRVPIQMVALVSVLLICLVMGLLGISVWGEFHPHASSAGPWARSFTACLIAVLAFCGLLVFVHSCPKPSMVPVLLFLLLMWALPPLGDYLRAELVRHYRDPCEFSFLLGCSPAGTLILAWSDVKAPVGVGLIVQGFVALVTIFLGAKWGRKLRTAPPWMEGGSVDPKPSASAAKAASHESGGPVIPPGEG
jgi:hypothetical protein